MTRWSLFVSLVAVSAVIIACWIKGALTARLFFILPIIPFYLYVTDIRIAAWTRRVKTRDN